MNYYWSLNCCGPGGGLGSACELWTLRHSEQLGPVGGRATSSNERVISVITVTLIH